MDDEPPAVATVQDSNLASIQEAEDKFPDYYLHPKQQKEEQIAWEHYLRDNNAVFKVCSNLEKLGGLC